MKSAKIIIPPKTPEPWITSALEIRLAEQRTSDKIAVPRGLLLHTVRALREAAGLERLETEEESAEIDNYPISG